MTREVGSSVVNLGLLGWSASAYEIATTKPAIYAMDPILRQKEEVLKANTFFKKAYSLVSLPKFCHLSIFKLVAAKENGIIIDH